MVRHLGLDENGGAIRVDPGCQPIDQQFPHIFFDAAGVGVVGG